MACYELRMAIMKELRDVCLLTMCFNWLAVLFKELRFTGKWQRAKSGQLGVLGGKRWLAGCGKEL